MGQDAASDLATCPQCGTEVTPTSSFCHRCGAQLGVSKTTLPPAMLPTVPPSVRASRRPDTLRPSISQPPVAHDAPPPVAADPLIGATVADRYRIETMIGRGGMGVVYKVEHSKIGKVMALKLLTGELARNRDTVRRFKREALMVSKLSHPNTVQVFDYGSAGGLTYLAMEFLSGQDLGELVERQGPRPFEQMAKIVIQACGALQEAHEKGMVHRDIKPENLFLTRTPAGEELVKVLDFGLAKLRESRELNEITSSGNIVGTPYYMPPEQVRGEDVDPRGDVYAMCALLYTCLTGTHVFEAPNPVAVLTMQLTAEPEPPHLRTPDLDIPESVSAIVMKGLAKEPKDRFQSAAELEEALRGEMQGETFTTLRLPESGAFAKPQEEETATRSEVERYERSLRRRELLAKATGTLVVLSLLGAGAHFYNESQKPPVFRGREMEPNHDVETATKVPFGTVVKGRLGQRLTEDRGDQDNYLIEVPASSGGRSRVHVEFSGLPNMGTCVRIFPDGAEKELHRFCSGSPGKKIDVPHLDLRAGKYLFVIKQDREKYEEKGDTLLHENVSDDYEFRVSLAQEPKKLREVEPNHRADQVRAPSSAQVFLSTDGKNPDGMRGVLSVMRDKDVVCAKGIDAGRFVVYDAEGGSRPLRSALQVTPLGGPNDKIPVRIHGERGGFDVTERDQASPWKGPVTDLGETPCLLLELVPNPWAPTPHPIVAPASDHEWRVVLEPATETPQGDEDSKKK